MAAVWLGVAVAPAAAVALVQPAGLPSHPPPARLLPRSALLAEGMHSLADVANQMLLKHGVLRSQRKPTREHQYGFHKEK